jgi:ketosteroid isomerase-like protein
MTNPEQEVAKANESFYRAFEALDLSAMGKVWSTENYIQCAHPGWQILRGRGAVIESWRRIFENSPAVQFMLSDVAIEIRDPMAWVTLYENITSSLEGQMISATVLTTNIFEKGPDGWRMIHHHGSTVAQPPISNDSTTVH